MKLNHAKLLNSRHKWMRKTAEDGNFWSGVFAVSPSDFSSLQIYIYICFLNIHIYIYISYRPLPTNTKNAQNHPKPSQTHAKKCHKKKRKKSSEHFSRLVFPTKKRMQKKINRFQALIDKHRETSSVDTQTLLAKWIGFSSGISPIEILC